jgi:hypothetical protein
MNTGQLTSVRVPIELPRKWLTASDVSVSND